MKSAVRRFYLLFGLTVTIAALATLALYQPTIGTRADFSAFNPQWNGASLFARDLYGTGNLVPAFSVSFEQDDVTLVQHSFAEYAIDPAATTLVVLGPANPPSPEEVAWLQDFMARGGRLLLADDFGAGNAFAAAVGAQTRFDGGLVLDLSYSKQPEFVVSDTFAPHPLTQGLDEVVLSHGTTLQVGPNATTLGWTSASSWMDRNGNVFQDGADPSGPFPWMAIERVGSGEILLMSDPSVLINRMRSLGSNDVLAGTLVTWMTEGGRQVLLDESHRGQGDPIGLLGAAMRPVPPAWRAAIALAGLALVLLLSLARPASRSTTLLDRLRTFTERLLPREAAIVPGDLASRARERHPDWDENALRDILRRWERP